MMLILGLLAWAVVIACGVMGCAMVEVRVQSHGSRTQHMKWLMGLRAMQWAIVISGCVGLLLLICTPTSASMLPEIRSTAPAPQPDAQADRAAIHALIEDFLGAWNRRDVAAIQSCFAPDAVIAFRSTTTPVQPWIARQVRFPPSHEHIAELTIALSPDQRHAAVCMRYILYGGKRPRITGHDAMTVVRSPIAWKIALIAWDEDPAETACVTSRNDY